MSSLFGGKRVIVAPSTQDVADDYLYILNHFGGDQECAAFALYMMRRYGSDIYDMSDEDIQEKYGAWRENKN